MRVVIAIISIVAAGWTGLPAQTTFTERALSTNAPQPAGVAAADIDGDHDMDVVVAEYSLNGVTWYENGGGSPPLWTKHVIDTFASGPITVAVGDVDRDGDVDVFSANFNDEGIAWYENRGTLPWTKRVISNWFGGPWAVATSDIDGDGDIDAIGGLTNTGCGPPLVCAGVEWYENDGAGPPNFIIRQVSPGLVGANSVQAADLDRDGDVDIVSVDTASDRILWFDSDGARPPAWTQRILVTGVDDPWAVRITDLDRDGDLDVASSSAEDDKVAWHENDGAVPPGWTSHTIALGADGALSIDAADFDGDGDKDLIAGSWYDSTLAWYESDGGATPTFTEHFIAVCGGPEAILAARLDADADLDVVCAWNPGNKIQWFDNAANYADADGDTIRDALDCAPSSAAVFAAPGEVHGLGFRAPTVLRWNSAAALSGSGTTYDVVRGSIAELRTGGTATHACLGDDTAALELTLTDPPAGQGFYYLARATNACGVGTYGSGTSGSERVSSACS